MPGRRDAATPFRWDLLAPDRLGSMLPGADEPDLWFLPDLVDVAGKVLARSGGGDLLFVGRSLDSVHDLVGAALSHVRAPQAVLRLPFSFARPIVWVDRTHFTTPDLTPGQVAVARGVLRDLGLTPGSLARRGRPVTFVDIVNEGWTFTELFTLVQDWVLESPKLWRTVRGKLRFVGVTDRRSTSPHTVRWHQCNAWTEELPPSSVVNVSLDPDVYRYLGDDQPKLTASFRPEHWVARGRGPARDEDTRRALAEAVAIVAHGRSRRGRQALARAVRNEPALAETWLRTLVGRLNR